MDRSDAGPPRRAGTRARGRDVPDARRGQQRHRVPRPAAPLRGRDPAHQPASCCWTSSARSAASTGLRAGCRSRPPGRRPTPSASTGRRPRAWMRRNLATGAGPHAARARHRGRLGGAAGGPVAAARALLHPLGGQPRDCSSRPSGGAQQDRFVGGSQLVALRMAEELGERVVLGAPVRRIEHGARRRHGPRRRRAAHAAGARSWRSRRRSPAASPTTRRCPATATSSPSACRWARSSSAWPSTTSPSGAARASRDRARATPGRSRSRATTRRRTARRASCSASSRAATRASSGAPPPRSGAPPSSTPSRACSARGRPSRDAYIEKLWAEEEFTRGCYGCHMPTGAWTSYGRALRPPIGAAALGGRRVRDRLERLHGRRGPLGRGRRARAARAPLVTRRPGGPAPPPSPRPPRPCPCS